MRIVNMKNTRSDAFIVKVPTSDINLFLVLSIIRIFQTTQALKNSVEFLYESEIQALATFTIGVDII